MQSYGVQLFESVVSMYFANLSKFGQRKIKNEKSLYAMVGFSVCVCMAKYVSVNNEYDLHIDLNLRCISINRSSQKTSHRLQQ